MEIKSNNRRNCKFRSKKLLVHGKKAFAFTFLAFFLGIILFALLHLGFFQGDYTKDNVFKESRIVFIDEEVKYFEQTYIQNVLTFSFYNTLAALENYTRDPINYAKINQNYTKFRELIKEGMFNGSFDGVSQATLNGSVGQDKRVSYFINIFKEDFTNNFKGNFSFDIINMSVYENKPYYISLQVLGNYSIKTLDNISKWEFIDNFDVSVPIYDLYDPEFLIQADKNVTIKSAEFNLADSNWTLLLFNEILIQTYASVFFEYTHRYSIGSSFISRFLNISRGSYKDVLGFWSFDYDNDELGVLDTSLFSSPGKHYGNTRLLMNFDNGTIFGNTVLDLSSYNASGNINGIPDCNVKSFYGYGCVFNHSGDFINISKDKLDLSNVNQITISMWVKPYEYNILPETTSTLFSYDSNPNKNINIKLNSSGNILMEIGPHNGGVMYNFTSSSSILLNKWSNVIVSFDGETGIGRIYINNLIDNVDDFGNMQTASPITNFLKSDSFISIGSLNGVSQFFNGSIDEVGIYSKILNPVEIASIYQNKKVYFVDYKDTFHGKGIEFDGKDDYVNLSLGIDLNTMKDFSFEMWGKFHNLTKEQSIFSDYLKIINNNIVCQLDTPGPGYSNLTYMLSSTTDNYYVVCTLNVTNNIAKLYVNGELVNISGPLLKPITFSVPEYYLGTDRIIPGAYFEGIIDEFKIYNRTLSQKEIEENYYNYDSFGKGCCNYLTLVNPNKFGYNTTSYLDNVSYSSKLFYDYHNRGFLPDIYLWNASNITSYDTNKPYYNFLMDQCVMDAYNVLDYTWTDNITVDFHKMSGLDMASCSALVELGIY